MVKLPLDRDIMVVLEINLFHQASSGRQPKAQISNQKKIQTSKLQTLTGRFMERDSTSKLDAPWGA